MNIRETYDALKDKVTGLFSRDEENQVPEAGADEKKTAEYVQQLFDDGIKYEDDHFNDTAHLRPILSRKDNGVYSMSPVEWRRACDMLAAGNLWDVIGRRNATPRTKWMSENVEGLIPSNMSVRGSYISSNWHDITITPNIQHADEFFAQERAHKEVGWTDFVDEFREVAQKYGSADCRIEFYDDDDGGHVCVRVIKPGDLALTPHAKDTQRKNGCWYVVHGSMINGEELKQYYPDLVGQAQPGGSLSPNSRYNVRDVTQRGEYQHTKTYPRLELFMDDETMEERPFDEVEDSLLADELDQMTMGAQAKVSPEAFQAQNHKVHIQAATEAIQNFLSSVAEDAAEEEIVFANNVMNVFAQYIEQHTVAMDEDDPYSLGMQKKYPFGRYVCVVGGVLAEDVPNPNVRQDGYGVAWRKLFHRTYSKKMYGRNDGVGDPETLFHDEKKASTALSRFEDSLILAMPKRYRHLQDKLNKATASEQEDNDPVVVGTFAVTPPVSISGKVAIEALTMREISVQKAERAGGVNNISIGGEPKGQSSGIQTQLLQKQNERVITGDLDRNLRLTLQEVIEGMFEMYKVWYVGVRQIILNGEPAPIDISKALSVMQRVNPQTGQPEEIPIPKLQISIRPFSNYPNRFEIELGALVEIYNLKDEMGMPMIPSAAIKKFLANKYPEAKQEWGELSHATQIGLQVMQQQQQAQEVQVQQQEERQNTIDGVTRQMERKLIKEQMLENSNGGNNG